MATRIEEFLVTARAAEFGFRLAVRDGFREEIIRAVEREGWNHEVQTHHIHTHRHGMVTLDEVSVELIGQTLNELRLERKLFVPHHYHGVDQLVSNHDLQGRPEWATEFPEDMRTREEKRAELVAKGYRPLDHDACFPREYRGDFWEVTGVAFPRNWLDVQYIDSIPSLPGSIVDRSGGVSSGNPSYDRYELELEVVGSVEWLPRGLAAEIEERWRRHHGWLEAVARGYEEHTDLWHPLVQLLRINISSRGVLSPSTRLDLFDVSEVHRSPGRLNRALQRCMERARAITLPFGICPRWLTVYRALLTEGRDGKSCYRNPRKAAMLAAAWTLGGDEAEGTSSYRNAREIVQEMRRNPDPYDQQWRAAEFPDHFLGDEEIGVFPPPRTVSYGRNVVTGESLVAYGCYQRNDVSCGNEMAWKWYKTMEEAKEKRLNFIDQIDRSHPDPTRITLKDGRSFSLDLGGWYGPTQPHITCKLDSLGEKDLFVEWFNCSLSDKERYGLLPERQRAYIDAMDASERRFNMEAFFLWMERNRTWYTYRGKVYYVNKWEKTQVMHEYHPRFWRALHDDPFSLARMSRVAVELQDPPGSVDVVGE